jgi:succinate dehydrogenase/fumarate reductase-like Fe-S protein
MKGTIRITIRREDRGKRLPSKSQTYEIQTEDEMTVLEALDHIYYRLDATLAHRRYRCGRKLCRSCEVKVDGKTVRGCAVLLRPGGSYTLEPARPEALIRDLVCDFDSPAPSSEPEPPEAGG